MKRFLLIALALPTALLAGKANPGAAIVATDEANNAAVLRDGSWTAMRAIAVPQTELFAPQPVKALEFGAHLQDPPWRTKQKVEQAWISCDGTAGVTMGSWSIKEHRTAGWYEKVWARMSDGSYRLLLLNAGRQARKLFSRPGRKGQRAVCTGKPPPLPILAPAVGTDFKLGASYDQTLIWSSAVSEKGEVRIVISLWDGTKHVPVLEDVAPAPAPR